MSRAITFFIAIAGMLGATISASSEANAQRIETAGIYDSSFGKQLNGYVGSHNLRGWTWKVRARVDGQWQPWSDARPFSVAAQ